MVDDLKAACLRYLIDVAMLSIHVKQQHLEALEALDTKACAVELSIVAHDLLEDISATPLA